MKNNFKNYIILIVLIITTVLFTLILSNIYIQRNKKTSEIFQFSNKINSKELENYIMENSEFIIYISNKYELSYDKFEKEFINTLKKENLKKELVYVEKSKKVKQMFKEKYKLNISLNKGPILVLIINQQIEKTVYINNDIDINSIIDYGAFK